MIIGTVTGTMKSREARISFKIRGHRGREREIEAVIDSGYSGFLTLPLDLIYELGLRWRNFEHATLADGSGRFVPVYQATVVWDRKIRRIVVDQTDAEPLVGMGLLNGYELKMQVRPRGKVTIKRLL